MPVSPSPPSPPSSSPPSPPSSPPPSPPSSSPPSPPPSPPPSSHHAVRSVLRAHRQAYLDGAGAIVLFFVCTLLICGLQQLTASISDFPAPILAMVLVAAVMILAAQLVTGIDDVYARYLRGPTDLLNRHMSIGFTVPFTMIMKEPMPTPRNVGLIIAGYIITGFFNVVLAYVAALGVQTALLACPRLAFQHHSASPSPARRPGTAETGGHASHLPPLTLLPSLRIGSSRGSDGTPARPEQLPPTGREDTPEKSDSSATGGATADSRIQSCISDATTLAHLAACRDRAVASPSPHPPQPTRTRTRAGLERAACVAATHPVLCASLAGLVLVGVPVAAAGRHETPLDVFVLLALWTGTLAVQAAVAGRRRRDPCAAASRWRPVLAALGNAVLWSSLGNIAYLAAKAAARGRAAPAAAAVLAAFQTGTTLADRIRPPRGSSSYTSGPGAGDLAVSVLDAGIVSWGLKLFECRAQLLSRAGAATGLVGAVLAAANLAGGPAALAAMGLTPARRALAFAARSVTLALAGPAMARLGGDVGLNAAMVVFNGIVFQVAMGLADALRGGGRARPAPDDDIEATASSPADEAATPPCTPPPRRGSASSTGSDDTLADSITAAPPLLPAAVEASGRSTPMPTKPGATTVTVGSLRGGTDGPAASAVSSASTAAEADAPATVALGTTVGINAAAMGTAYLYENAGRAAPYAALSMTVFGVMTVVFASIQPLADWVISTTT